MKSHVGSQLKNSYCASMQVFVNITSTGSLTGGTSNLEIIFHFFIDAKNSIMEISMSFQCTVNFNANTPVLRKLDF